MIAIRARGEAQRKPSPHLLRRDALVGGLARLGVHQIVVLAGEELHDPLAVPEPRRALLAGLGDALAGELAHRLEHVKARLAAHFGAHEQVLFHERSQAIENVEPSVGHHRSGRVLGEAAGEDAEAAEEDPLLGTQQVEAPLEGGAQRLVSLRQIPLGAAEQRQRLREGAGPWPEATARAPARRQARWRGATRRGAGTARPPRRGCRRRWRSPAAPRARAPRRASWPA